jgi:dihydroorotate dehydrogenase (NAD+) catalytic subunit
VAPVWATWRVPVVVNIAGDTVDEFGEIASRLDGVPGVSGIEANISCPNVAVGGMLFGQDPKQAAAVTAAVVRATTLPVIVKLTPNVTDIVAVARAVVDAGADALTAINTVGPGMVIDLESGYPILANRVGGVSGAAIRPIAVRCVYDLARAVDVPIIGTGGVGSGRDALELVMAGATLVGVGSAVYAGGPEVFAAILSEMKDWMAQHRFASLDEIRGRAHEPGQR